MNLREQLLLVHSKANTQAIAIELRPLLEDGLRRDSPAYRCKASYAMKVMKKLGV